MLSHLPNRVSGPMALPTLLSQHFAAARVLGIFRIRHHGFGRFPPS